MSGIVRLVSAAFLSGVFLTGCYQAHSDDDLRTVPVTNNPHIVPSSGHQPFSGFGY
jgi:hypothetical protein